MLKLWFWLSFAEFLVRKRSSMRDSTKPHPSGTDLGPSFPPSGSTSVPSLWTAFRGSFILSTLSHMDCEGPLRFLVDEEGLLPFHRLYKASSPPKRLKMPFSFSIWKVRVQSTRTGYCPSNSFRHGPLLPWGLLMNPLPVKDSRGLTQAPHSSFPQDWRGSLPSSRLTRATSLPPKGPKSVLSLPNDLLRDLPLPFPKD